MPRRLDGFTARADAASLGIQRLIIPSQNKVQFFVHNDSNVTGLLASLSIVAKGGGCVK